MWRKCKDIENEIINIRRELHQIPEVGSNLPKTKEYVKNKLKEYKIDFVENSTDSAIIAFIKGSKNGKTIVFRADMDALPIKELNDIDYISKHEGSMHACGHDAHTAMLLTAAKILNENKSSMEGNIKLFFQTDEEGSKGAKRIIENGFMDNTDAVFALHIGSIISKEIPSGKVVAVEGSCMASFDKFVIKVKGEGSHGSTPEKGIDPINIAAHIIINLQEIIAREIAAVKPSVLTIGHIEAGFAYNVIPDSAIIEGTIRALEENVRITLAERIKEISENTAKTFRGLAECEIIWGAPPVVNNSDMAFLARECAEEVVGKENVVSKIEAPSMVGEDFSYYLEKTKGAFLFLSSADKMKKTDISHHNAYFNVDESVLWIGSALFVKIAQKLLNF